MKTFSSQPAPLPADAKPAPEAAPPACDGAGTPIGRSVSEWIGASPDTPVPPRVRVRVFERYQGRCYLTGRAIRAGEAWQVEHIIALCNGGANSESNLAPVLSEPHKIKTKADVREKSKVARLRKRHLGIKKPRSIRAWRNFKGEPVYAERDR